MKLGQLLVTAANLWVGRELSQGAAMLLPLAMIAVMVFVAHNSPIAFTSGSYWDPIKVLL